MVNYEEYNQLTSKYKLDIINPSPNVVYHYTNADALINIIEKKKLWLTNSFFLNDKQEILYIDNTINDAFKLLDMVEPHKMVSEFRRLFFPDKVVSQNIQRLPQYFILSSTMNHDNHLLWSYYTNNDGYNIGLDLQLIESNIIDNIDNELLRPYFGMVSYDPVEQHNTIAKDINSYFKEWMNRKEPYSEETINLFKRVILYRISMYSIFFKNPFFKFEEEYRIVFILKNSDANQLVKFRNKEGTIIPYIDSLLNFTDRDFPIKSVTIGPKNYNDISHAGLRYFLDNKGLTNTIINRSIGPLRF